MLTAKSPSSLPDSLLRLFGLMRFRPNSKAADHQLHPFVTPAESFARPEDDIHAFEILIDEIERIDEEDFGDFMRRVNLYLSRFQETLRHRHPDMLQRLKAMPFRLEEFLLLSDALWAQALARQWLDVELSKIADRLQRPVSYKTDVIKIASARRESGW